MINHIFFGLGALILSYGCISQEFEKSELNVLAEFVGFFIMVIAYII